MPGSATRKHALDHVIVVLFENRSLDNLLGSLYGPKDGKTFEGVIGKDLSNPIPAWAEHGADRKVVPYAVATDMDSPNTDSGEANLVPVIVADIVRDDVDRALVHSRKTSKSRATVRPPRRTHHWLGT